MGKPAARVTDMHTCPMVNPGPVPHVGGPVMPPGCPTVFIAGMPAARVGDMATCTGPPDSIVMGSIGVFIGGMPAARMGDNTAHGGVIVAGCPTVFIGEVAPVMITPMAPGTGGGGPGKAGGGGVSSAAAARQSAAIGGTGEGEKKDTETHWLDVKFVDKAGYPITGVNYELTGTDGKKSTGRLGGNGKIRKDGIDSGNATVELFSVHNARWSTDKARVGDKVKLTADVIGYPSGTKAVFEIWEKDVNTPDDRITRIETKTKGDKVETEWEYQYTEDVDDSQTERESKKGYSAPEYYFIIKVENRKAKSGLLGFRDWIEIELIDGEDNPIAGAAYRVFLANGEIREGKLDANGYKKIDNVPPGEWDVEFPEGGLVQETDE